MSQRELGDLDWALSDLGASLEFPPTPDLAAAVRARIDREGIRPGQRSWWPPLPPLSRSAVLALLALLALAGTVLAATLVIGGLRIRFVEELPSIPPTASAGVGQPTGPGSTLRLGRPVALAEARAGVAFSVVLPEDPALGGPDAVYVSEIPPDGMVSLVWGPRPGLPERDADVSILLTEFRAGLDPGHFEKLVHSGATVVPTDVAGAQAYWISGAHFFLYRDAGGDIRDDSIRLAGPTLVWERDGVVLRLEGAPSLEVAERIARTIR